MPGCAAAGEDALHFRDPPGPGGMRLPSGLAPGALDKEALGRAVFRHVSVLEAEAGEETRLGNQIDHAAPGGLSAIIDIPRDSGNLERPRQVRLGQGNRGVGWNLLHLPEGGPGKKQV